MLAHEPSDKLRDIIVALCVNGIAQSRIAAHIGIDAKTMRKFYRRELDLGTERANAEVTANLFRIASSGSDAAAVTAAKYWLGQCGLDEPEGSARELIAKRLDELNKNLTGGHQVVPQIIPDL